MTRDDIIRMAREAGIEIAADSNVVGFFDCMERFADLVAAHKTEVAVAEAYRCGHEAGVIEEREACAKVCEDAPEPDGSDLAERIRERGKE